MSDSPLGRIGKKRGQLDVETYTAAHQPAEDVVERAKAAYLNASLDYDLHATQVDANERHDIAIRAVLAAFTRGEAKR